MGQSVCVGEPLIPETFRAQFNFMILVKHTWGNFQLRSEFELCSCRVYGTARFPEIKETGEAQGVWGSHNTTEHYFLQNSAVEDRLS